MKERKHVNHPLSLKGLSCWHCFKQCWDWRAWWLGNNHVSQCATWMLANSLEQWLRQKGKLRSPYSLQSKWDKTERVGRQPVAVIPSGNSALASAWPSRPLWEAEQRWCLLRGFSNRILLAFILNPTACTTWEGTLIQTGRGQVWHLSLGPICWNSAQL